LEVEVTNVSSHGFWLLLEDRELFLPFDDFPWFREVPIRKILRVECHAPHHLYWPDLDVDLAVDSIEHPNRFPLVSRVRSAQRTMKSKGRAQGPVRGTREK
jgi:hypothetical protein